jgi:hypothetical protein
MGGTNPAVPLLRHVRAWAETDGSDGSGRMVDDPLFRERVARTAIVNQVSQLLTLRAAWIAAEGGLPGLEGSMAKVFASEEYQRIVGWFQQMAGAEGLLGFHADGAAADGWIDYDARHAPVTTIYGGTSEINRNNIAERHLGLPRNRWPGPTATTTSSGLPRSSSVLPTGVPPAGARTEGREPTGQ